MCYRIPFSDVDASPEQHDDGGGATSGESLPFDYFSFDLLNDPSSDRELSSASACPDGTMTAFIRIAGALLTGVPTMVTTVEMITCAQYCKTNIEPLSGQFRPCRGFNYQNNHKNDLPTCEFFDHTAKVCVIHIVILHDYSMFRWVN